MGKRNHISDHPCREGAHDCSYEVVYPNGDEWFVQLERLWDLEDRMNATNKIGLLNGTNRNLIYLACAHRQRQHETPGINPVKLKLWLEHSFGKFLFGASSTNRIIT